MIRGTPGEVDKDTADYRGRSPPCPKWPLLMFSSPMAVTLMPPLGLFGVTTAGQIITTAIRALEELVSICKIWGKREYPFKQGPLDLSRVVDSIEFYFPLGRFKINITYHSPLGTTGVMTIYNHELLDIDDP